ncbi:uncharacterized protein LOC134840337 isoform X2 [Symsagittifera roscoffensis]|uniref:uncharacterized protein LOC134840337 isoform X2 n=1 Tax=Symsagittifera roscoffensis TaxID=84072 RepID=UPI00307B7098
MCRKFYLSIAFCYLLSKDSQASFNPARKKDDCQNGFTKSFFDAQFQNQRKQVGQVFDDYCYTHDLSTWYCCLDESLLDGVSYIENYTIEEVVSQAGAKPVVWESFPVDYKASIVNLQQCVSFSTPASGAAVKVRLNYTTETEFGIRDRSALYYANFANPNMPFTVQYLMKDSQISVVDNNLVITVKAYDNLPVHYNPNWQLCYCIISSQHSNHCQIKDLGSSSPDIMINDTHTKLPARDSFEVCVALAAKYPGTFGYNRSCEKFDLQEGSLISWTTVAVLVIVLVIALILVVISFAFFRYRRLSNGSHLDQQSSTQKIPTDDEEISIGDKQDNHYAQLNYEGVYCYDYDSISPDIPQRQTLENKPLLDSVSSTDSAIGQDLSSAQTDRDGAPMYQDSTTGNSSGPSEIGRRDSDNNRAYKENSGSDSGDTSNYGSQTSSSFSNTSEEDANSNGGDALNQAYNVPGFNRNLTEQSEVEPLSEEGSIEVTSATDSRNKTVDLYSSNKM